MRRHENHKYTEAISYQMEASTRIDPHDLKKYFQAADIRTKAAELSGLDEAELFGDHVPGMVQIKTDFVLVECNLECGLPLLVRVPISYYEGVGARFVVSQRAGNPVICLLELVHKDPSLTLPLLASTDLEEAAVDWKSWSRRFNLAMLHKPLGTGTFVPARIDGDCVSGLEIGPQKARRHHAQFAMRRPRFLTRRKVGQAQALRTVSGREIIART